MSVLSDNWVIYIFYVDGSILTENSGSDTLGNLDNVQIIKTTYYYIYHVNITVWYISCTYHCNLYVSNIIICNVINNAYYYHDVLPCTCNGGDPGWTKVHLDTDVIPLNKRGNFKISAKMPTTAWRVAVNCIHMFSNE